MKNLFIFVLLTALAGCASVQNAGVASYSVKPIVIDGKQVCCEVAVLNGKEVQEVSADIMKRGDDYEVHVHEVGVAAFKGQQISADATRAVASEAGKTAALAVIAPMLPALAPVAGAALASPGIGAAAVGAGAVMGAQRLKADSAATMDSGVPIK